MRQFGVLILVLSFITLIGCDGDGDGNGNGEAAPADGGGPTTITVAQGTATVPSGGTTPLAAFTIAEAGTLTATVTWSGAPANVMAGFVHEGATTHGVGNGGSPFTSTATVTDAIVISGHNWEFVLGHGAGVDVDFTYVITFTRD